MVTTLMMWLALSECTSILCQFASRTLNYFIRMPTGIAQQKQSSETMLSCCNSDFIATAKEVVVPEKYKFHIAELYEQDLP